MKIKEKISEMLLKDAMKELLKKKEFSKITVKEVCELANVNRSTFYTNYRDIYELLQKVHYELFTQTDEKLRSQWKELQHKNDSDIREQIFQIVESVKKNKEWYMLYVNNPNDNQFEINLMQYYKRKFSTGDYAFVYHAIGCFAMLLSWMENGCKESCEEIADIIYEQSRYEKTKKGSH